MLLQTRPGRFCRGSKHLSGNTMVSELRGEKAPLANAFEIWRKNRLANQSTVEYL